MASASSQKSNIVCLLSRNRKFTQIANKQYSSCFYQFTLESGCTWEAKRGAYYETKILGSFHSSVLEDMVSQCFQLNLIHLRKNLIKWYQYNSNIFKDALFQSLDMSAPNPDFFDSCQAVNLFSTFCHKTFHGKIVNLSMARFQTKSLSFLQQTSNIKAANMKITKNLIEHLLPSKIVSTLSWMSPNCSALMHIWSACSGRGLRRRLLPNSNPHLNNFTQSKVFKTIAWNIIWYQSLITWTKKIIILEKIYFIKDILIWLSRKISWWSSKWQEKPSI